MLLRVYLYDVSKVGCETDWLINYCSIRSCKRVQSEDFLSKVSEIMHNVFGVTKIFTTSHAFPTQLMRDQVCMLFFTAEEIHHS